MADQRTCRIALLAGPPEVRTRGLVHAARERHRACVERKRQEGEETKPEKQHIHKLPRCWCIDETLDEA